MVEECLGKKRQHRPWKSVIEILIPCKRYHLVLLTEYAQRCYHYLAPVSDHLLFAWPASSDDSVRPKDLFRDDIALPHYPQTTTTGETASTTVVFPRAIWSFRISRRTEWPSRMEPMPKMTCLMIQRPPRTVRTLVYSVNPYYGSTDDEYTIINLQFRVILFLLDFRLVEQGLHNYTQCPSMVRVTRRTEYQKHQLNM